MDPKGVLEFAAKNNAKILDLRFVDLPGIWQHVSFPIQELDEDSFKDGFGFDASSIRGWAAIHESDMLLVPDPNTAFMDAFRDAPTRSEEHTSELQSRLHLVCRLLLEKKKRAFE